jgi:hypothetical protein
MRSVWAIVLVGLVLAHGVRAHPKTSEYGPAKGSLVIAGGGSLAGTLILENFVLLAGGRQRRFIIVPTAEGNRNDDGTVRAYDERRVVEPWIRLGVRNVRMLHTHDPKVADTEQFVEHLKAADAVWFDGGRQWTELFTGGLAKGGDQSATFFLQGTAGVEQAPVALSASAMFFVTGLALMGGLYWRKFRGALAGAAC